jgi:pimeloyl-ACP methyl ester carboxylesterase
MAVYAAAMADLPERQSADVTTSFGTVWAYRCDGPADRTPIVLLPGRNASTPMWRANIGQLLEHRTVIATDLLGEAGLAVQDRPITGADDEAHWLDEALAGLGLSRAHLLGVSIGGWTATNAAIRRPGRIASVMLLDAVMTFAPGRADSGTRSTRPMKCRSYHVAMSTGSNTSSGPSTPQITPQLFRDFIEDRYHEWEAEFGDDVHVRRTTNFEGKD